MFFITCNIMSSQYLWMRSCACVEQITEMGSRSIALVVCVGVFGLALAGAGGITEAKVYTTYLWLVLNATWLG